MRTRAGLLTLVLGVALAACNGAGDQTTGTEAASLSEETSEEITPEPPDEATSPEPIPPDETPPDIGPPNMRADPLPPGSSPAPTSAQ